ncbi:MAG: AbgT family transporter, partial [Prevotellaceae bacterium]|nr:AbgT family transporter [Prevotellaceae bacterium]
YSHLNQYLVLQTGTYLALPADPLLALFAVILFTALINLVMPSAGGKWTLLAFVFIPLLAERGVAPEITQCAFRIGDSCTNALSPVLMYVPFVLSFMQHKNHTFGFGDLWRCTWRYSLAIGVVWVSLFLIWYLLHIPFGF